jgi:hypothetical protein
MIHQLLVCADVNLLGGNIKRISKYTEAVLDVSKKVKGKVVPVLN